MWHAFGSAAGHVGKSMPKPILACVPGSSVPRKMFMWRTMFSLFLSKKKKKKKEEKEKRKREREREN